MNTPNLERLHLIKAEANRVMRSARVLRQMVAREIEQIESATDTNDSPGGHTHDDRSEAAGEAEAH